MAHRHLAAKAVYTLWKSLRLLSREERLQAATIALWRGCAKYDPSFGTRPEDYLLGAAIHGLREARRDAAGGRSRYRPEWCPIDDAMAEEDQSADPAAAAEGEEAMRALESLRQSDPLAWEAIRLCYVDGMLIKDAAASLGVAAMTITRRRDRGLRKLREKMGVCDT
jgi:RNA polymerase sigma factor (sigma-70 family)